MTTTRHTLRYRATLLMAAGLLLTAAVGCESTPEATPVEAEGGDGAAKAEGGDDKGAAKDEGAAKEEAAPASDGNYTIKTAAGELASGADGEVTVTIKPATGYKINEEFPWKAAGLAGDAVLEPSAAELAKDKWTMNKKEATLKVPVKVKSAGEGQLKGKVTFSVCSDTACDVIRDKEIAWKVAAK